MHYEVRHTVLSEFECSLTSSLPTARWGDLFLSRGDKTWLLANLLLMLPDQSCCATLRSCVVMISPNTITRCETLGIYIITLLTGMESAEYVN